MAKSAQSFGKGDWIVHHFYGVGQIKGIEKKELDGEKTSYYKVQAKNSLFFIPVGFEDNDRLRPLASKRELNSALKILKKEPEPLNKDHNQRKRELQEASLDGSLAAIVRMVRDLSFRQLSNPLNPTEEDTLRRFKQRFAREWSVRMETDEDTAEQKINTVLSEQIAKAA
ncbi:MAG: hypothetical protein DWQ07_23320 [Chloroflexi bacterium]|nr:MAG: hypothetical protein DWQ07_23320 [Chloroflexota bacterium]MBL1194081.1 hypothetical protein [Chloroflexota bacterium]NOH11375.1 hypothetical protein [Chloroflexota bacterium]